MNPLPQITSGIRSMNLPALFNPETAQKVTTSLIQNMPDITSMSPGKIIPDISSIVQKRMSGVKLMPEEMKIMRSTPSETIQELMRGLQPGQRWQQDTQTAIKDHPDLAGAAKEGLGKSIPLAAKAVGAATSVPLHAIAGGMMIPQNILDQFYTKQSGGRMSL